MPKFLFLENLDHLFKNDSRSLQNKNNNMDKSQSLAGSSENTPTSTKIRSHSQINFPKINSHLSNYSDSDDEDLNRGLSDIDGHMNGKDSNEAVFKYNHEESNDVESNDKNLNSELNDRNETSCDLESSNASEGKCQ